MCLAVFLQDGASTKPFFPFLLQSQSFSVSLADPRVHAGTRFVSPLLLPGRGQNGSPPWLLFKKKKNLLKTPQSKQIGHACFSRSNDVTKALPFPSRVNTQREAKRLCQLPRRAFSFCFCELKGDILISPLWISGRFLCAASLPRLNLSKASVASWLALERWRKRRKWSHLTDRPCYYCYFGSPVMRRAAEPPVSDTTTVIVDEGRPGPTPPSRWTRRREPRWRLGQGGRRRKVRGPRL